MSFAKGKVTDTGDRVSPLESIDSNRASNSEGSCKNSHERVSKCDMKVRKSQFISPECIGVDVTREEYPAYISTRLTGIGPLPVTRQKGQTCEATTPGDESLLFKCVNTATKGWYKQGPGYQGPRTHFHNTLLQLIFIPKILCSTVITSKPRDRPCQGTYPIISACAEKAIDHM